MIRRHPVSCVVACLLVMHASGLAQRAPLTLGEAVDRALAHYPSVQAGSAAAAAADASLALARTAYLPRADVVWQANRATRNNVAGLLLPQSIVSSITGPVTAATSASTWNSAAGVLVAWEPVDFGYRSASVRAADATRRAAGAEAALTRLTVAAAASDAFLAIIAADETVRAARAGVERARIFFDVVDARARAGLRPGADAARARAEVAAAESVQARAEQAAAVARAELSRWTGIAPADLVVAADPFLALPPASSPRAAEDAHPVVQALRARVDAAKASADAAAHAYAPRIFIEGTTYARGTGTAADGTVGALNGFETSARNWAAGVNVTFPLLDLPSQRDRHAVEAAREREAAAHYDQARQDLDSERLKAAVTLDATQRIASLTPAQLDAARTAERQARARFESGLGTVAEVADTERLLIDADTSNALAIVGVWRAQIGVAVAAGDLSSVLRSASDRR
jgi:outer membrane protein